MQATIGGTTSVTSSGAATVTAPSVTVDAQTTTLNGNLVVNGAVNVSQTVTAATDVIGGGISLKHHTHADPQGGDVGAPI